MNNSHYLTKYDDAEIANAIKEAQNWEAREFAERIYIPVVMIESTGVFAEHLAEQQGQFAYDVYARVFELFGKACPYQAEDFSVDEYSYGEDVQIGVIHLPKACSKAGDFLQTLWILDSANEQMYYLAVEKNEGEGACVLKFDMENGDWNEEAAAPADQDELLELALELTVNAGAAYEYITGKCPLCGQGFALGLTPEEMKGYRAYQEGDEDLQDAIPALNAFEREFLMTGMCPDCQSRIFRKEIPKDLSRWALA